MPKNVSFKIEKGVPIAKTGSGNYPHKRIYPFDQMKTGDSFFAPKSFGRKVQSAALKYGKDHGIKFKTRAERNGRRVWRVA
jgi:hypothetical protein